MENLTYYVAPLRRVERHFTVDPLDGAAELAASPYQAALRMGLPEGQVVAAWVLLRAPGYAEAGRICTHVPPVRAYLISRGELLPLGIDPVLEIRVEVPGE